MPGKSKPAAVSCPLLEGNQEAWVACCSKRFFPLAKRIAGEDDLVQDLLQESWAKVLEDIHDYRGGSPACAWVRAIVFHLAIDAFRSKAREVPILPEYQAKDPDPDPEALARQEQMLRLLREIVVRLPQVYRQVLELRYGRDLSPDETAAQLHISRTNVNTRLNRAATLVRRHLEARLQQETLVPKAKGSLP